MKITKKTLEKLRKELEILETVERKRIAERLKKAVSFGDISENADYEIAKEEQLALEQKIAQLKAKISQAEVVNKADISFVGLGCKVELELENKEVLIFEIVDSEEVNPLKGKISLDSPLGKALENKRKGDKITLPNRKKAVIKKISLA